MTGYCAVAVPHCDAAGHAALDGTSVKGAHDGGWSSDSFPSWSFICFCLVVTNLKPIKFLVVVLISK